MKLSGMIGVLFFCTIGSTALAGDLGFRYKDGRCMNSAGVQGLNPSFFGQCSDLRGAVLQGLDFAGVDFRGSSFLGSDLQKSSFAKANLEGVTFESAMLSGVNFDEAIVIKASFNKANLKEVKFSETQIINTSFENAVFEGGDLTYIVFNSCNLKGANFNKARLDESQFTGSDLSGAKFLEANLNKTQLMAANIAGTNFSNSTMKAANLSEAKGAKAIFNNVDLTNAKLMRAQLPESRFARAVLTGSNLAGVDFQKADLKNANLTGTNFEGAQFKDALFSKNTLLPFSADDAAKRGMIFSKIRTALILWDALNDYVKSFAAALNTVSGGEVEATFSPVIDSAFNGTQVKLADFDAVIHLNGAQPEADEIALDGQKALVNYVQNGGTFIYGEWESYVVSLGRFTQMRELILFQRQGGTGAGAMHTVPDAMKTHPLLTGVTSPFQVATSAGNIGPVVAFSTNPVQVLATDSRNSPSVGLRALGKGRVVGFNFTCTYTGVTCLNEANVRRLYINAISYFE